ncbi:MAG: nucleotidyltransferase family protein [Alphaproteobacteria bacterium]|nr:nucleotidyltransferase family protein [Alphaproteobacteria bacterium]
MSGSSPRVAMVLAAGLGTRLRPITDALPKPLVEVAGRTILDRALDALLDAGVERCVVNTHYLAPMIEAHLAGRTMPHCELSHEEHLLDTGGGVARALPALGPDPFFVVNADILWDEGPAGAALARLAAAFDAARMDALLLMVPRSRAVGYDGPGDFSVDDSGRLARRGEGWTAPYVFTGLQILAPRLFDGCPDGAFSLNLLYDRAIAANRLFGVEHDGRWFHIGTPAGLELAQAALARIPPAGET